MLCSAGLVLIMTPGVAFFYGGMVKHKNVVATLLQNFVCMGLVALCFTFLGWVAAGCSSSSPLVKQGPSPGVLAIHSRGPMLMPSRALPAPQLRSGLWPSS